MNPFEAFGEAMQTVGLWFLRLPCLVVGHRWEAMETYYPGAGLHYEGEYCRRCWKMDYYDRPATPHAQGPFA